MSQAIAKLQQVPIDQALRQLLSQTLNPSETQVISLPKALGRVLAEDVIAPVNVPPQANSAMDGYCLRFDDWYGNIPLPVSQRIAAGSIPKPLAPSSCAQIFTGAELPDGADTVVMQEEVELSSHGVIFKDKPKKGQNIRPKGQDVASGSVLLRQGCRLRPQELGLLASVGLAELKVYSPLKVAIFSTGDEIIEPGQALLPGQIYNSNRYLLMGLLTSMGLDIIDLGTVKDSLQDTTKVLREASNADLIISSGGASVGEEDHVRSAINALGKVTLWKLAIKPGKPFIFGHVLDTPYMGLPGNPAAVLVTFCLLCRPWLLKSQGASNWASLFVKGKAGFSQSRKNTRQEYIRARANWLDGELWIEPHPNQSSGMLSSACWGNGLAVVAPGTTVDHGDDIDFLLFDQFLT